MQLALFCSTDSLLASAGIGLLGPRSVSRRWLILTFAISDLIASVAGASLHSGLAPVYRAASIPLVAEVGLPLLAVSILAFTRKSPLLLFIVPILLSLDNFFAGLLQGSAHASQFALLAGLASGLSAWIGLVFAQFAAPAFSQGRATVTGLSLVGLSFMLLN
jgi:hypothetical protein